MLQLDTTLTSSRDLWPCWCCLLPRIIPFQKPLKIKELLQKVTEAFGQQMDMFFMEKEVQKQLGEMLLRYVATANDIENYKLYYIRASYVSIL